jgi:hypothetical protein
MKQSKLMSWLETFGGTALGFALSLAIQQGICWWYSLPLAASQNLVIIGIFTVASLIRGYWWRRICEALHIRRPLSPFMQAVIAERFRQIEQEGWDTAHDDAHYLGELAKAGAAYAFDPCATNPPVIWPWDSEWWKPEGGMRRNWVKAAALILAEGERFDRNRKSKRSVA